MKGIVAESKTRRRSLIAAEWNWRIPISSRTKIAHLIPVLSSIRRRYQARCGVSINPGFCKIATYASKRCINCSAIGSYVAP